MKTSPTIRNTGLVYSAFSAKGTLIKHGALARGLEPIYARRIISIIAVSIELYDICLKNYLYTSLTITADV